MRDFGVFVRLEGVRNNPEGMVHISAITNGPRLNKPSDAVSRGQRVKVKVMSAVGSRLGLSMKDVDQVTGQDLTPHLRVRTEEEMAAEEAKLTAGGLRGYGVPVVEDDMQSRARKRLSSPERFELKQMIASGVIDASELALIAEEDEQMAAFNGIGTSHVEDAEEELDVEVCDEEPAFLQGQTRQAIDLSPVKIVKAPDGTLNRAALQGAALAKERREMK
jgi:ATP-dependent RNA helicase DHX8/PRP22